jgi:uncharacterized protein YciW
MVHHAVGLVRHCNDPAFVEGLQDDPDVVETTPQLRALIDYSLKLTRMPMEMRRADIEALRDVGYADDAIVAINQIAGWFNYVNRTVDGLGVQLEEYWPEEVRAAHPHPPD